LINEAFEEKRIESFEDAIQFCSAKGEVEVFITRNKRDYDKVAEELEALTPAEFLKKY